MDQTWSNWFKLDQTWTNWFRLDQIGLNWINLVQLGTNLIKLDQIGLNWIKLDQIGSNLIKLLKLGVGALWLVIFDYWKTWLKLVMLENLQACFIIFSANMDKKYNLRMLCNGGNSFDHQQHEPRMKRALLFSHSVTRSCHERRHHSYLDNAERWCYFADSRLPFFFWQS